MNLLKWVLIAVCVLKAVSFTICTILNSDSKELDQFFKAELIRKYTEHSSVALGNISRAAGEIKRIARDSTRNILRNRDADIELNSNRNIFQNYVKYIRQFDTIWHGDTLIDLNNFPELLRNTVSEENAKREIFTHFKNIQPEVSLYGLVNFRGMITGIDYYKDSLQLNLIPFIFDSHLPFDSCICGSKTLITKRNPFYYSGSLTSWECIYKHPKSNEIQTYGLKAIE